MYFRKKTKAYTLVEVIMVVAVMSIVVMGTFTILTNFTRFWRTNQAKIDVQRDSRIVLSLINRRLRQAQQSGITIDQVTGAPPWSRITFTDVNSSSVSYYQSGTRLYQTVDGKTIMLGDNLRTLRFTYPSTDDGAIIGVSVCFEKATYEGGTRTLQMSIDKVRVMN